MSLSIAKIAVLSASLLALTAASSAPVAPGNRKAYCRGEVSAMYGTKPIYVTTGKLLRGKGGTTHVDGTVDKGNEGIKKFSCRYDARGRFIDVMALTSDGE
ncbi:hypothetical protein [Sphingomonas jaspsi]|uniref:hypothetical protein n=1 Tax=Sphingomonas jaspsi TaxID=392409 RepID=UPI0004B7FF8C|nr:hypothetical protein [Sphingomonas jaspsi]